MSLHLEVGVVCVSLSHAVKRRQGEPVSLADLVVMSHAVAQLPPIIPLRPLEEL